MKEKEGREEGMKGRSDEEKRREVTAKCGKITSFNQPCKNTIILKK